MEVRISRRKGLQVEVKKRLVLSYQALSTRCVFYKLYVITFMYLILMFVSAIILI